METEKTTAQVVIIGGGPVGLALAIELGMRSVRCLVLERSTRVGFAPRAKTTHTRTREHLRRWGIADELAAASPLGVDYPSDIVFVTRLGGYLLHRFERALDCSPERNEHYSEHAQWVPQYKLEEVLLRHARRLPTVDIRLGQEFCGSTQQAAGVTVQVKDRESGLTWTVGADYLVGADGARSAVREVIGAKMIGIPELSRNYNIIFRAPGLDKAHKHGRAIMFWQINPDAPSLIGPMDVGDLWFMMPTKVNDAHRLSQVAAEDLIRRSTGFDGPLEVLSADEWTAAKLIADRYRDGRIFLAGDACHLHPPFGGFGMNLGVSDGVDLGWKLAAVLSGWAGEKLLGSYETERRQVHEFVVDAAAANHATLADALLRPHLEEDGEAGNLARAEVGEAIRVHKRAEFFARGVVLGYCYQKSPVIRDDGTQANWVRSIEYTPSAIPGCIAPHRWLDDGRSLYDRFGAGFTLLVNREGCEDSIAAAQHEAARLGVPLEILELPNIGLDGLYEANLALIRPDQHIAWRGASWPTDGLLGDAAGQ